MIKLVEESQEERQRGGRGGTIRKRYEEPEYSSRLKHAGSQFHGKETDEKDLRPTQATTRLAEGWGAGQGSL